MSIYEFVDKLVSVLPAFYHDEANQETGEYGVWSELSDVSYMADGEEAENKTRISIDVYSDKEFTDVVKNLKKMFDKNDISYEPWQKQYYPELHYTMWSTTIEVV